jgi:peptidyl-prolyl cis-trans isomerase-like 1
MVQAGDPTGTGRGGESVFGGFFEDEITKDLKFTGAGILAMATSGAPSSNGSQFFISLAPTPWLDGKHTIFGRICSGMKIVQRLGCVACSADDRPLSDLKIVKASPSESPDVIVRSTQLVTN